MSITQLVTSGPLILALPVAAAAGAVTFLSPCCLPLVPGYLSFVTGMAGAGSPPAADADAAAPAAAPGPGGAVAGAGSGGAGAVASAGSSGTGSSGVTVAARPLAPAAPTPPRA